jgi:4-hydroxybenzoyl-CoA reductase subunit beta
MEYLPEFRLHRPGSVAEAMDLVRRHPGARFVAGGTDLIVNLRRGIVDTETLIDLTGIAEIATVESGSGGLRVGAAVRLNDLADDARVRDRYHGVAEAAQAVAGPTHRQAATVGGNLCLDTRCVYYNQSEWWRRSNDYCLKHRGEVCHVAPSGQHCFAAYSGDLAPALLVLGAEVELTGPAATRTIPLDDLFADDGRAHLRLAPDELLTAVRLPPAEPLVTGYEKARVRGSIDFPLAGVAVALARRGEALSHLRIALTGTNSRPILVAGTDAFLDRPLDDAALNAITRLLPKQIQPMTSTFTPPGYRRRVVVNLTRKLLRRLYDQA